MLSLDLLTINEDLRNREDLAEIFWKAFEYFPDGVWRETSFVGNLNVRFDLEIRLDEVFHGAFIFSHLLRRIRKMKDLLRIEDLLLGVTHDPVIVMYYRFDVDRFRQIVDIVHDYVSDDVGLISLFETDEGVFPRIAAHGLGHSLGLKHHAQPLDLMYIGLLHGSPISINGFCEECKGKLNKRRSPE